MPDSKGEEQRILLRFEVSTEIRGERFADQNITGMQGNIGQQSFFQKKRKLLLEKASKCMCGVAHMKLACLNVYDSMVTRIVSRLCLCCLGAALLTKLLENLYQ